MPLHSIQLFVQGLLDGLPIPGSTSQSLEAYVAPPPLEELGDNPKAYIWASRMTATRQTMPRDQGFKHLAWDIDVWLSYETLSASPTVDSEFPLLADAVMTKLWTTTLVDEFLTDPVTLVRTQVLSIGEDFTLDYPPARATATQRTLYYTARLGIAVYEAVQG